MHPFIHPLSKAVDPAWECPFRLDIYKGIARKFSELTVGHLGLEKRYCSIPTLHDTARRIGAGTGREGIGKKASVSRFQVNHAKYDGG